MFEFFFKIMKVCLLGLLIFSLVEGALLRQLYELLYYCDLKKLSYLILNSANQSAIHLDGLLSAHSHSILYYLPTLIKRFFNRILWGFMDGFSHLQNQTYYHFSFTHRLLSFSFKSFKIGFCRLLPLGIQVFSSVQVHYYLISIASAILIHCRIIELILFL